MSTARGGSSSSSSTVSAQREAVKAAIVHEKQERGSMLCAQHCLNNLLQGHYFDAAQLADIATQLDGVERGHLDLDDSQWGQREQQSRNADETGFFSVGVVETALQVWGLSLRRWAAQDMRHLQSKPEAQLAFVLNLESHWFTFRSFGTAGDIWFNLNSFLDEPTWVGSGYLGALLDQAQREGYSVFVARPTNEDDISQAALINQFRGSPADQAADKAAGAGDSEDAEMMQAIQASLASSSNEGSSSGSRPNTGGAAQPFSTPSGSRTTSARASASSGSGQGAEGKRKKSRRQTDEGIEEAIRASLGNGGAAGSSSRAGASKESAIELNDSQDAGVSGSARGGQASRSPFLNPALRDQLVEGIDDDGEDFMELPSAAVGPSNTLATPGNPGAASRHGGPQVPGAPARQRPSGDRNAPIEIGDSIDDDDDDDDDYEFADDSALAARDRREEELHRQFTAAAQAYGTMRDARDYDDEDAELQRALAASMADSGASGSATAGALGAGADHVLGEDWMSREDAAEQARIFEEIAARGRNGNNENGGSGGASGSAGWGRRSPTPADVGRIAKMREEARRKEREEREREERHQRGEFTPEPEPVKAKKADDDDSDDDDEDDEEEQGGSGKGEAAAPPEAALSPEELRKMRLARFGG